MKILIVGGGGREHALAWKLRRDDPDSELFAAPGNPGIAAVARCVPIGLGKLEELAAFAESERIDLTVVGPEGPLEAGIVNLFQSRGLPIFGPTREAARIETSKRFAKELMTRAGVPTARAAYHTDQRRAKASLSEFGAPVVVKASGLAAGKGVVVAQSMAEAEDAIDAMLSDRVFGDAGGEILIEEFMEGEELSLFVITDGERAIPLLAAQDHKRLLDGDFGPNTGGMGAYAPTSIATPELPLGGSILINEEAAQSKTSRSSLTKAALDMATLPGKYLDRQLSAVFACHDPFDVFEEDRTDAAVIVKLFAAIVDWYSRPRAKVLVVCTFIRILKSSPAADVVD